MLTLLEVKWRREGMTATIEEETRRTIRILEELGDELGLARAWHLVSRAHADRFEMTSQQEATGRALMHARNASDTQQQAWLRIRFALALFEGPAPLAEVSRYNQENLTWARANHNPRVEAAALALGGQVRAMQGDFVEARALVARGRALFEELGVKIAVVGGFMWSAEVEELACDLEAAEHYDDAESLLQISEETAERDDRWLQVDMRLCRARVLARRGQTEEAVGLAREAVALAAPPDAPLYRAAWLLDAAATLSVAGRHQEAISLAEEALTLYEDKGNLVMAGRAQERLRELREQSQLSRSASEKRAFEPQ